MKQKLLYLVPVTAILLGSCSDLGDSLMKDRETSDGQTKIYASFAKDEEETTRTSLGSFNGTGFPYRWDDADAIGVFSVGEKGVIPTTNAIFKYDALVDEDKASFIGTPQILKYDDIWAYYPWSSNTAVESGRDISLTIRSFQNYNFDAVPSAATPGFPNGSFGQGEAPAVAWGQINIAEDNSYTFDLSFNPVAAYLTIPITGTATVSSVGISVKVGNDNPEYVQLAGTLNIDMTKGLAGLGNPGFNGENGGYAILDSPGTSENGGLITLDCGRGVQLDPENPTWFWFVVPADMPTTDDTQVTIYVNGNLEFLYTFNRTNNATPIGRNKTLGLSLNNSKEPFVYEENGGIPDNMELAFPDPNFREYVLSNFDTDGDGVITEEEALTVEYIICDNMGIQSLLGIQYFTNLIYLYCPWNELTSLNLTNNTQLTYLDCQNNRLTYLDLSGCTSLPYVECQNNQLTTLNLSGCSALRQLYCNNNQLTTLDLSGCSALSSLRCDNNQLTTLDLSGCAAMGLLECNNNQIAALDLSGCSALSMLSCKNNQLTTLDLSGCINLYSLSCDNNRLTDLDLSGFTSLSMLSCDNNQLTTLDLSGCTALEGLYCHNNQLATMNLSGCTALYELNCDNNQLTDLDLSGCTAMGALICENNQLNTLNLSGCTALAILYCQNNQLTALDLSGCMALNELECYNNQLTTMNLSGCTNLYWLICENNQLSALDLSDCSSLSTLNCENNRLTTMNLSGCTALEGLNCNYNQLTDLDLSGCISLSVLRCNNNQLANLDLSGCTALKSLYCENNQLAALDLSGCTALSNLWCNNNLLTTLNLRECINLYWLNCKSNQLITLDLSNNIDLYGLECNANPNLTNLILRTGQEIPFLSKDDDTEIEYINP